MATRFLPSDIDRGRPLAIIAGRGLYPALLAQSARDQGLEVRLVALEGEAEHGLLDSFPAGERRTVEVGKLGDLLAALRDLGAGAAVMAGQVAPRKLFSGMVPDLRLVALLARLPERNAETIFGAVAAEIEAAGVRMVDARACLDAHLASEGRMTGWLAGSVDADDLAFGVRMAREMARLDIGQSVVVARGTVIAVEAFEGTDNMLRRCAATGGREMLLVKAAKHGQDWRFDVPCFGERTLESMAEGGVRQAALEADGVLLLDKPRVLERARALGITLVGFR